MEKVRYRTVTTFLSVKGKWNDKIKIGLDPVYDNSAPSIPTIQNWTAEFKT